MKFVIDKSEDGQFYFVLKANNGEIVATSETYKNKRSCKHGIKVVRKCADAEVIDNTRNQKSILIALLLLLSFSIPVFSQVSDDWGKYRSGDTVRVTFDAKPYLKYMSKKARVTCVSLTMPDDCAFNGISVIGSPFANSFGIRYDYLPKQGLIGYYASIQKNNDWHGSKRPSWIEYSEPVLPDPTIDVWYTGGSQKCRSCDPDDPWYPPAPSMPCPLCPDCPPCEPEIIYIHDTTWVHMTTHHYVPPDETVIEVKDRIKTSVGLSVHFSYYWDWYVTTGIALNGYVYDKQFTIPFGKSEYKPIGWEIGATTMINNRYLCGFNIDTSRPELAFQLGIAF